MIEQIGRVIAVIGLLLVVVGGVIFLIGRFTPSGRLPGDIVIERPGFTLYLPLATMILVSVVLSAILWFIAHLRR